MADKRTINTEATRRDVLTVATQEFADKGFAGARVDEIAARTATSKRMIYYHFASKEGLYRAVLEHAYAGIREIERGLALEELEPSAALDRLVSVTFDYHWQHPEFVRLVMSENMQQGAALAALAQTRSGNDALIERIGRLLDRGAAAGIFRAGIDAVQLHMTISALAFYNVSNRYSFSILFDHDMASPHALDERRAVAIETVRRWCAV